MFPSAFKDRMQKQLGDDYTAFLQAHQSSLKTSIRLNSKKNNQSIYKQQVPWCKDGYYLDERPNFTLDPNFHAGSYYVQEASSMMLEQVILSLGLDQKPVKALDLCAAPGGKSTHLISLLHEESLLMCNELVPKRFQILKENMTKWGAPNVLLANYKTEQLSPLKNYFDLLLVDAPCSGEGLFRKNPASLQEWTLEHSKACGIRQQKIVDTAVKLLAPGGVMIYSTCTYNPIENIDILVNLAQHYPLDPVNLDALIDYGATGVTDGLIHGIQAYPQNLSGEGFFIGALQKEHALTKSTPYLKRKYSSSSDWSSRVFPHLTNMIDHQSTKGIYSVAEGIYTDFLFIQKYLPRVEPVLKIGELKGIDLVPDHALALSQLPPDFPTLHLNHTKSLLYLRKESLPIKSENKGWHTVAYEGNNLGWVKVLDKRINNYYPSAYRIKH